MFLSLQIYICQKQSYTYENKKLFLHLLFTAFATIFL